MEIVADANVLLSAAIGGRAKLVLQHPQVTGTYTTISVFDEVFEYVEQLAKKRRLRLGEVLLTVAALPVTIVEEEVY